MRATAIRALDLRFPLPPGAGSDSVHSNPIYSLATCVLETNGELRGTGFSLTLGEGNDLVCAAIGYYAKYLVGEDIDEVMGSLGERWHAWANDSQLRWLVIRLLNSLVY
jgi:L-fuconate dehydratase